MSSLYWVNIQLGRIANTLDTRLGQIADALNKEQVGIAAALDQLTKALADSSTQQKRFNIGVAAGVAGFAVVVTAAATVVVFAMRQTPASGDKTTGSGSETNEQE